MQSKWNRVFIIGLDGATWNVLNPMIERGVMPNLARLKARAAHGDMLSCVPPVTSAAWTTMVTGNGPQRHGVYDHRRYDAESRRMRVNHSGRVRVPTMFHKISDAGGTVVSINVPVTYPPLKIKGLVVSGLDAPHLEGALSGNAEFADAVRTSLPDYHHQVLWKKPPRDAEEFRRLADETRKLFAARAESAWIADRMFADWSVMMVQFQNLDPFQHRCWPWLNVDEAGIDDAPMNRAAEAAMNALDSAIGRLLELAEARGAGVMVSSDHGFGPCNGRIAIHRILMDKGLTKAPSTFGTIRRRRRQAMDHLRLWLEKQQDKEARSASFDLTVDAQFAIDWNRSLGFAPHQDTAAMIYLNRSWFRKGAPLTTPRQIDDAKVQFMQVLSEAADPADSSSKLFREVIDMAATHGVDPAREGYPDVIALPRKDLWVRTKITGSPHWVEPDHDLPGTHRPEGIVMAAGPGISPGQIADCSLIDFAPTVLARLGMPELSTGMEGADIFGTAIRQDPGHAGGKAEAQSAPHRPTFEYDEEEQRLIEQRLADLGYLE
ncbi:phosphodiesterase [bacterium]|nr:phosphodiesterase [bacterium]